MSHTAPTTTLPQILRQPTGIAVLASLGIHGLLWATLPSLHIPSQPTEGQQRRSVGLVELTPAEQNRLPQAATPKVNTPQVTLPPFATQPSVLPPLPPPPFGLLNSPGILSPSIEKPLYNYPLKPVIPPKSQVLQLPVRQSSQTKKLVPPSKPIKQLPYKLDKGTQFQPYSRRLTDNLQGITTGSMSDVISPGTPTITPSPSPSTSPSTSPGPSDSVSANTSLGDAAAGLAKTMAGADGKKLQKATISPVYPKAACHNKLEGLALATVEISSTAQMSGLHLIKSTGSATLDHAALIETSQYKAFKPDSVYTVRINYKYDSSVCSSN